MAHMQDIRGKFGKHFCQIVQRIVEHVEKCKFNNSTSIKFALSKMKTSLEYNVPYGKQTRGLSVVASYYDIMNKKQVNADMEDRIMTLGWAVEMLQASFLVADDVMDQSDTRRGRMCWYRKPQIGLSAVNDALLLESCVFVLLKMSCRDQPFYADLVDLFHGVILKTELGQSMDMATTENPDREDFSLFTKEHYINTITYKTSYYSFYLPVAVALYVAGHSDESLHAKVSGILAKIGQLFQIQDDYLDCYGDPEVTGKIGTDIEDNKCSWLMVQAIKNANDDQIRTLKMCYGRKDKEMVARVKSLFQELNLESIYKTHETKMYEEILREVEESELEKIIPKSIFLNFLNKIYGRKK